MKNIYAVGVGAGGMFVGVQSICCLFLSLVSDLMSKRRISKRRSNHIIVMIVMKLKIYIRAVSWIYEVVETIPGITGVYAISIFTSK